MRAEWNHNTAYHGWILSKIKPTDRVLDVGCGEGALLLRLADAAREVVGLEPHEVSAKIASTRARERKNASVEALPFEEYDSGAFDVIIFVASLHHTDTEAALSRAKAMLAPDGRIIVVGCAKAKGARDLAIEGLLVIPARLGGILHGERNGGRNSAPTRQPSLSYREIKEIASRVLPGAELRRGLYYRYLMYWRKN